MSENRAAELIDVAAGRRPADLVLRNGRVVNVVSHELIDADVAIHNGRIAGVGMYDGRTSIDIRGRYLCPGFIDAHVHIESSMLAVQEFARVVVAHGTTAVVADPHEFANVLGAEGIAYVLRTSQGAPIRVFVMLSSCVPASPLESAGATLDAAALRPFLSDPRVLGLAEMMNYPGVIHADPGVLEKIAMCEGRVVDGHAPWVSGRDLNAYAAAGIMSDHECITARDASEKLRAGLSIMIREGSQTRNLAALLPLVKPETADRFMFCTDDKDVRDLIGEGQIDHMIRTAIASGLDPLLAVRMGSWNAARYFRLAGLGAILPGYHADIAVLEDLRTCRVCQVFRAGEIVAADGRCVAPRVAGDSTAPRETVKIRPLSADDLRIPAPPGATAGNPPRIHVIQVLDNRIDTERAIEPAIVREGCLVADPSHDLAKLIVVERHRASGEIGRGFARGFGLTDGALAGSVAHDAHNLIAVGTNNVNMRVALDRTAALHGGWVVARDGRVVAEVPLPIAGLVTDAAAEEVAAQLGRLTQAVRELGCPFAQPFMCLAFLSLSVIGKLKLTNLGLIDVEKFAAIPLVAT